MSASALTEVAGVAELSNPYSPRRLILILKTITILSFDVKRESMGKFFI